MPENLSLSDFEAQFLALHPDMPLATPDGYAKVVEDLFWVVEDYVADPALRDDIDLADDDLRRAVNAAHIALRA